MFRTCDLVLVNQVDLLEHLDFDLDLFFHRLDAAHLGLDHMLLSARTGEGLEQLGGWLQRFAASAAAPVELKAPTG